MNKQLTSLTIVALLLVSLNVKASVQLLPSAGTININDSFTVNVQASELTNIDSVSVKFSYDPAVVRLDGISLDGGAAFCDLIVRDTTAGDGQVEAVFALAQQPTGESCPALSGDFVAFQLQMTALAEGNSTLTMSQEGVGFGWTSENNPSVVIAAAETTAEPIQLTVLVVLDTDADGVADNADNCIETANADQLDSNADGYGNRCDPDFDGNLIVNTRDYLQLRAAIGSSNMEMDLDGNGVVNTRDYLILRSFTGKPPGPSGTAP